MGNDFWLALLVLILCPAALAEEAEVDIENAPTPTRLAELMPEGAFDVLPLEAWAVTETTGRNGRVFTLDLYTHWSYKMIDGQLVMELSQGRPAPNGSLTRQRFTYTAKGEFVSYHEVRESRGKRTADMIGKVEGDELVIKPNPDAGVLNANLSRERRVSLEIFESHVPIVWMPLVRAYHIRSGHLGYTYATVDLTRSAEKISRSVEDVGTETLSLQGREALGHLLIETATRERNGRETSTKTQLMVLRDGAVVSSQAKNGRYTYKTKRVLFEEIRERFGLEK